MQAHSGEIEYQKNDKSMTFENGGVWKRYPDGSLMVSTPRIFIDKIQEINYTTIGIVSVKGDSSTGGQWYSSTQHEIIIIVTAKFSRTQAL